MLFWYMPWHAKGPRINIPTQLEGAKGLIRLWKNVCFFGKGMTFLGFRNIFYDIFLMYNGIWIGEFAGKLFPNMLIKIFSNPEKIGLNYTDKIILKNCLFFSRAVETHIFSQLNQHGYYYICIHHGYEFFIVINSPCLCNRNH